VQIFDEGVDGKKRMVNKTTYTTRNYCIITRADGRTGPDTGKPDTVGVNEGRDDPEGQPRKEEAQASDKEAKDRHPKGEISGGDGRLAKHVKGGPVGQDASALAPATGTGKKGALNISLRLEIDGKDPEGKTKAYGFSIPPLEL